MAMIIIKIMIIIQFVSLYLLARAVGQHIKHSVAAETLLMTS